ncbi:DUF3325 domain-containing protein [Cognaticolwellia mytili]|uniref:DUF3325 domain-containing protein n=1 Tax=Cognaticolwellia mytili TaxID=1888913 RepID=UPI000A170CEE|nr:DUF3325 domain-containing protein [Cognaticolwellia mytili]
MLMMYVVQLIGLISLSLAMHKHFKSFFKRVLSVREDRMLTVTGWLFLALSIVLLTELSPRPLMIVYWTLLLGLNIVIVAGLHSVRNVKR